jgi:4-amino-4-deoxy-L-arabinose transferase-like glycosyltransferase
MNPPVVESPPSTGTAYSPAQGPWGGSITTPERSLRELGIALLLFALSALYLRLFYDYSNLLPDEGIVLDGAQRILQGQVLYRDFFSYLTPGSYYWMTALFKVFGSSILVARAALMVYSSLFSAVTYLLARRVCSHWNALFAILPTVFVCMPFEFQALHNWDSTLWALLAVYCAVRWIEVLTVSPRPHRFALPVEKEPGVTRSGVRTGPDSRLTWPWALATGTFVALTVLFEQSKGAGLVLGLVLGFFILRLCAPSSVRFDVKALTALAFGLGVPILLTVAYFALHRSLPQMMTDLLWPFRHYSAANKLPYGFVVSIWQGLVQGSLGSRAMGVFILSPLLLLSALPIFAVPVAACAALQLRKNREAGGAAGHYLLLSTTFLGLLLSTIATGRPDATHIIFEAPLFCLVLGWMAEAPRTSFLRAARTLGVSYVLISFAALGAALLIGTLTAKYKIETRRGALRASAPYGAFEYIQSHIKSREKILVYPYQPLLYYLTATDDVSRYEYLFPGMNTAAQFEDIERNLEATRPAAVLFNPDFLVLVPSLCPNVSAKSLAAIDPVATYLARNYRVCRTFDGPGLQWHVIFMVRKNLSCHGDAPQKKHPEKAEKKTP